MSLERVQGHELHEFGMVDGGQRGSTGGGRAGHARTVQVGGLHEVLVRGCSSSLPLSLSVLMVQAHSSQLMAVCRMRSVGGGDMGGGDMIFLYLPAHRPLV